MLGNTPFTSFGVVPVVVGCMVTLLLMWLMYLGFWREEEA